MSLNEIYYRSHGYVQAQRRVLYASRPDIHVFPVSLLSQCARGPSFSFSTSFSTLCGLVPASPWSRLNALLASIHASPTPTEVLEGPAPPREFAFARVSESFVLALSAGLKTCRRRLPNFQRRRTAVPMSQAGRQSHRRPPKRVRCLPVVVCVRQRRNERRGASRRPTSARRAISRRVRARRRSKRQRHGAGCCVRLTPRFQAIPASFVKTAYGNLMKSNEIDAFWPKCKLGFSHRRCKGCVRGSLGELGNSRRGQRAMRFRGTGCTYLAVSPRI